jgi:predicted phosphodiesterase
VRYGVVSDIHANLPALRAALSRLRAEGVDRWLCAGDLVGYGPQPNECVAELAALDPVCIAGNHELIALGELSGQRCSRRAKQSLDWTRNELAEDTRRYLTTLPRTATLPGLVMAHGSLADAEEYIRGPEQATAQLDRLAEAHPDARVLLLGHTHRVMLHRHVAGPLPVSHTEPAELVEGERYLVNPGSVGQSRQREPHPLARFALLELPERGGPAQVRFFAERYDHRAVRRELRAEGLPADSMHVRPGPVATAIRRARRVGGLLLGR